MSNMPGVNNDSPRRCASPTSFFSGESVAGPNGPTATRGHTEMFNPSQSGGFYSISSTVNCNNNIIQSKIIIVSIPNVSLHP